MIGSISKSALIGRLSYGLSLKRVVFGFTIIEAKLLWWGLGFRWESIPICKANLHEDCRCRQSVKCEFTDAPGGLGLVKSGR